MGSINNTMIARIWHGKTPAAKQDEYAHFLKQVAIPDYRKTKGFQNLTFLKRVVNDEAHFTLITIWDSIDSIKNFAGVDFENAKYYPEDKNYLVEFEEKVIHHEIFATL